LAAVALLAAVPGRDFDREIARQRKDLDALRSQLVTGQKELSALKAKKSATVGELEQLSANIALTDQYLHKLESVEQQLAASVDAAQEELRGIQGSLDARSAIMARRVRLLFMAGRPERLLFNPESSDESGFFRRAYWVKRMVRYDRRLVDETRDDMGRKRENLQKLLTRREELEAFRLRKREEMKHFTRAKADQERTLSELQQSESVKAEALRRLRENARKLTEIIAVLEKRRQNELARNPRRKARELETGTRYCLPVGGPVVSRYGMQYNVLLGTSTRNLGIEVEAPSGTPVRAAVSGEVALITRIPGYGQGVILDNGSGYFTIYANLGGILVAQGDKVKTCQEIAYEAPDPGRVYFEVRKGAETLDPEAWLKGK
jgi:septal ring factor EnvC (AmiA/AmiB activator)